MLRRLIRCALALAIANGASACGKGRTPSTSADPSTRFLVEVSNGSSNTMEISTVRSGVPSRLGDVGPGATATFELPKAMVNVGVPVRFTAVPKNAAGSNWRSVVQEIQLSPGRTARFNIPPG